MDGSVEYYERVRFLQCLELVAIKIDFLVHFNLSEHLLTPSFSKIPIKSN